MILDSTTRTLEAVLGAAHTTNQLTVVLWYYDFYSATFGVTGASGTVRTATSDTTAVTILQAPVQANVSRKVAKLVCQNVDTATAKLTIRLNDGGTAVPLVTVSLSAGDNLIYDADAGGWKIIDQNGNTKVTTGGGGGGGGTPGGSSGQIQYNSSGSFGGFTASGDATINTSTGAVTVSKTGGTAFGALATLGVGANLTSGGGNLNASAYDFLSSLVNSPNALSNPSAATLAANTINVITATAACNAKMPAPAAGKVVGIAIDPSSTNLFTLNPNVSETINFAANTSRIMWAQETAYFRSDGTNWFLIGGASRPMLATMKLSASQSFTASTETLVTLDTSVTDNTGLLVDTTNHRINLKRSGSGTAKGVIAFSGSSDASSGVPSNSGAECNILDNSAAGGTVFAGGQGKNSLLSGTNDATAIAVDIAAVAGHYIAMEGYMGVGATIYFLVAAPAAGCSLSYKEDILW